jgi:hypothetical protein
MPKPPPKNPTGPTGPRKLVSAHPLTPEQLVKGIFQIAPDDVKRIVATRPGKKAKGK